MVTVYEKCGKARKTKVVAHFGFLCVLRGLSSRPQRLRAFERAAKAEKTKVRHAADGSSRKHDCQGEERSESQ
jgi:hypothetical protein